MTRVLTHSRVLERKGERGRGGGGEALSVMQYYKGWKGRGLRRVEGLGLGRGTCWKNEKRGGGGEERIEVWIVYMKRGEEKGKRRQGHGLGTGRNRRIEERGEGG